MIWRIYEYHFAYGQKKSEALILNRVLQVLKTKFESCRGKIFVKCETITNYYVPFINLSRKILIMH